MKSQDASKLTSNTLDPLPLTMPGAIQSRDLLRVLVCAAASRLSGHPAWDQLKGAPSGPTVLGILSSQCSALDALEGHGKALLAPLLPKGVGQRGRRVAMDVVALPYHGTVEEAHQDAVCRSTATCGPPQFFPYATASAVVRGRRSTLAMCRVRAKQTRAHVVRPRLERLVTLGIRITLLLLDRGFDRVRVLQDLSTAALPCIMPAVTRGNQSTPRGGPSGTSALAAAKQSRWTSSPLQSAHEGHVAFALAVGGHHTRGKRGRHQRDAMRYATWGVTPRSWRGIRVT